MGGRRHEVYKVLIYAVYEVPPSLLRSPFDGGDADDGSCVWWRLMGSSNINKMMRVKSINYSTARPNDHAFIVNGKSLSIS